MSDPKRHHYLPKSYLERFCVDGKFFVYDRKLNETRPQTPINSGLKTHYYSSENEKGEKNPEIETDLLSKIDDDANKIISKLINHEQIDEQEKEAFSIFLGLMMNRTPHSENSYNLLFNRVLKQIVDPIFSNENALGKIMEKGDSEENVKEMSDFWINNKDSFKATPHRNDSLKFMLEQSFRVAEIYKQMDFNILYCSKKLYFLTSDNPLFYKAKSDKISDGKITLFPLSGNHCLNLTYSNGNYIKYVEIGEKDVEFINSETAKSSYRFIFGKSKKFLRKIVSENNIKGINQKTRFYCGE